MIDHAKKNCFLITMPESYEPGKEKYLGLIFSKNIDSLGEYLRAEGEIVIHPEDVALHDLERHVLKIPREVFTRSEQGGNSWLFSPGEGHVIIPFVPSDEIDSGLHYATVYAREMEWEDDDAADKREEQRRKDDAEMK